MASYNFLQIYTMPSYSSQRGDAVRLPFPCDGMQAVNVRPARILCCARRATGSLWSPPYLRDVNGLEPKLERD